ncbi:ABC transporter ATP-binding protein [Thermobifida halotolerans]|uniref:ABC transporter ATP-binding protein n=1 Tax=Thermobifida halotolerans TaxID=483545 RepID=A0AA97M5R5_9ACTN|nr:ABC transporter ATP-binding protein [Thermobifida halotolerans]UOE21242.1 ABC transporter ATP-binding protein [Thermobifida halotolerans]
MTATVSEHSGKTPTGSGSAVLDISGVDAGYGPIRVLQGVDLSVSAGEIVSLLGPNGAGKTTTLLACSGMVRVTSGDIRLDGRSLLRSSPHAIARRRLAHVPEDRSLFPSLTIDEHLRLCARPDGLDVLELFPELQKRRNKRVGVLSGGEQQMLALGRALAAGPRVLLVDEMSMGLAPVVVERLFSALQDIAVSAGLAVLMVEQHVHLALKYAQRGYVLAGGRVRTHGTTEELRERWSEIESSYLGR